MARRAGERPATAEHSKNEAVAKIATKVVNAAYNAFGSGLHEALVLSGCLILAGAVVAALTIHRKPGETSSSNGTRRAPCAGSRALRTERSPVEHGHASSDLSHTRSPRWSARACRGLRIGGHAGPEEGSMKFDTMLAGLTEAPAHARRLEDLGVDGAFTFEGPHDVFTPLVLAAAPPPDSTSQPTWPSPFLATPCSSRTRRTICSS